VKKWVQTAYYLTICSVYEFAPGRRTLNVDEEAPQRPPALKLKKKVEEDEASKYEDDDGYELSDDDGG
jgi:hypothetical protein